MGPEIEDISNLQLDVDSIRSRAGVRSSLTDINQIFVFSDSFRKTKESVEKEQQAAKEELYGTVFVKTLGKETELKDFMFLENTEELLVRNEQEAVGSRSWSPLWILPVMVILFATAFYYKWNGRGKKKYDADNQSEAAA